MTMTDFMAKVTGWIDSSEKTQDKETATKIADLESRLAAAEKKAGEQEAAIEDLTAKLEAAQNDANAKGTEIKTLQANLEAEKKRVDETLAAQGVSPKTIPTAKPEDKAAGADDILSKLDAIKDPVARADFWNKNKAAIQKAAWTARKQ